MSRCRFFRVRELRQLLLRNVHLSQFVDQTLRDGDVNLDVRSSRFLEAVASEDDIFLIEDVDCVKFRGDRLKEKVLTRWREMDLRVFRRKDSV